MCHKGHPFRPYRLHAWGPTLEVCSHDSFKNRTNVPRVCLEGSQYCLNQVELRTLRTCHPQKKQPFREQSEGNGGMYNVTAIISSVITTIKLKS